MDNLVLARLQFGLTASFHIIFPSLVLGLSMYLAVMEALWLRTGRALYRDQYQFWIKPFAAVFVIAVATGVVLSHQLDTVFGGIYKVSAAVLLPVRTVEFFNTMLMEAGCFAVMVFGWRRVGKRLHFAATLLVTVGVLVSTVCILMRNSWMQTPSGAHMVDGRFIFSGAAFDALLSPSFPYRLFHVLGGATLCTAFFMLGIAAWFLLRRRHAEFAQCSARWALGAICVAAPLQLLSGDLHGLNTSEHQPAKLAAMEGLWETTRGAPLVLFAVPDAVQERNRYTLEIPQLASLIIKHERDGEIVGLKAFAPSERPNVPLVFYSFRIMVVCGMLMLVPPLLWLCVLRRRIEPQRRWFLWLCCAMGPSGFVATIAGWCVTEAGRQPWVVYGLVRSVDVIDRAQILHIDRSMLFIGVAYVAIMLLFLAFLRRTIVRGPYVQAM